MVKTFLENFKEFMQKTEPKKSIISKYRNGILFYQYKRISIDCQPITNLGGTYTMYVEWTREYDDDINPPLREIGINGVDKFSLYINDAKDADLVDEFINKYCTGYDVMNKTIDIFKENL